jgi:hypothetical protein
MRILYLFALCLASAISPSAAGQSGKPAAPSAPAKNAPAQNTSVHPAAQNAATANGPAQVASQDTTAQNPARQNAQADATTLGQAAPALSQAELERLLVQLQDAKPGKKYSLPQVPFDKGIYAARNAMTGNHYCLAIQSYNFSQGESPKLESVTTCTSIVQPLMRFAQKPESRNQQEQGNQQNQEKDQK